MPIQQLNSNNGTGKMQMLIQNYNHYLDMIRAVTGLNEARDGTRPDTYALVGLQKLAALSSNTATRHILDAGLTLTERLCTALSNVYHLDSTPLRTLFDPCATSNDFVMTL